MHFGVFVGGMGNFTEIFFGNQENFRGCLESVYFNGVDVLTKAKVLMKEFIFKIYSWIFSIALENNCSQK